MRPCFKSFGVEWYTPAEYVEAARRVLGEIDLDPASSAEANETVKATRYYDKDMNGLAQQWRGRLFLNPPFGPIGRKMVARLIREHDAGTVTAAVLVCNLVSLAAKFFRPLYEGPICVADHRVEFRDPERDGEGNIFGTVFVYLGPHEDRFIEVFSQFGPVVKRVDVPVGAPR